MNHCTQESGWCAITTNIIDIETICIKKAFLEESSEELKRSCTFECHVGTKPLRREERLPIIQEIKYREYIVTAVKNPIFVQKEKGEIEKIQINFEEPGAYKIKMTCMAKLIQANEKENITLIDRAMPCFKEENEIVFTHILPAQMVKIPNAIIENNLDSKHEFAEISGNIRQRVEKQQLH